MVTSRIKKSLIAVPQTVTEAAAFLLSIAGKQREINRLKKDAKIAIDAIKEKTEKEVRVLVLERDTFFNNLFAFASAHKKTLTEKARSQKTSSGVFGWRWTTPYVEMSEGRTEEEVIAALEKQGLSKYIRVHKELDREALLRERPTVSGINYSQRDEFFAKPKLLKEDGRGEELVKEVTETIDG